jgi:hypothetical protein
MRGKGNQAKCLNGLKPPRATPLRESELVGFDFPSLPVYPWNFVRTNTIFGVIHAAGGYTAWSDKHPAYSAVSGPGNGTNTGPPDSDIRGPASINQLQFFPGETV